MEYEEIKNLNGKLAILRADGQYSEAIQIVRAAIPKLAEKSDRVPLLLQALFAANALHDVGQEREFASLILAIDPEVPSAKKVLNLP